MHQWFDAQLDQKNLGRSLARHSGVRSAKNVVGAGQSTQWDEIFFDLEDLEDFFDVISPREEKSYGCKITGAEKKNAT